MRLLANVVNINVESELFTVTPHSLLPPPPPHPLPRLFVYIAAHEQYLHI